jgi:hypothetical protein
MEPTSQRNVLPRAFGIGVGTVIRIITDCLSVVGIEEDQPRAKPFVSPTQGYTMRLLPNQCSTNMTIRLNDNG